MKVQVEDVSPIEKRLNIEVDPAMVKKELSQAYTALSHQVRIPGFRPGKIPRHILEQRYRNDVEADVSRRVRARAFMDAIKSHNVFAVGEPQMSGGTISADAPFSFSAKVEVKPVISVKDFKGLSLKKLDGAVAEEKVEEQLTRLREGRATLETVSGRDTVKTGDMAVIDFDATIDGQPFPGNTGRAVTVEVAPGELIEGNLPQLDGMKVGEKRDLDYAFPADYRVEEVKGKTARFAVTLNEIKEKKVPALDDAFAEQFGAGTATELKAKIRTDLERAAKNRLQVDERENVFTALIAKNPFDVPRSMIERAIDMMLDTAIQSMARQGMDPRQLNLDWSKLRSELAPRAETDVRGQLLLEALAAQEKFEVSNEDVEKRLEQLAEETGAPLSTVRKQYKNEEALVALKSRIAEEKAIALIKQHATFA